MSENSPSGDSTVTSGVAKEVRLSANVKSAELTSLSDASASIVVGFLIPYV